jgi:hypothetical protein
VGAKTLGQIVYLSGVVSTNSEGVITGTAGLDRTIEQGYAGLWPGPFALRSRMARIFAKLAGILEPVQEDKIRVRPYLFPDSDEGQRYL